MKRTAMLLSLQKTKFKGRDGNPVECGKVQIAVPTDNGYEPVDYFVSVETYDKFSNLMVGYEYDACFDVDFIRKRIKLLDLVAVN